MERKLLIKDGIQDRTGQVITENYYKEMIDIAVIKKPLMWFQEKSLEKKLRPVSHPHGCKTTSFALRFSDESLSKKQRDTWIPSNKIQNQTLYWL